MPPAALGSLETGACPLLHLDDGLKGAVLALEMTLSHGPSLSQSGFLSRGLSLNVQQRAQGPLSCPPSRAGNLPNAQFAAPVLHQSAVSLSQSCRVALRLSLGSWGWGGSGEFGIGFQHGATEGDGAARGQEQWQQEDSDGA